MIEIALRYELQNNILEIADRIYPTNAPANEDKPYLVYGRLNPKYIKSLNGYTGEKQLTFMFNIITTQYSEMVKLRKKVAKLLIDMQGRTIGEEKIFIEDIAINTVIEKYEFNLRKNRGIIDFTIYFNDSQNVSS